MSFERRQWLAIVVISAGLIAALTAAFWAYTQDDVYITYTYSRNIAEGQGFVFNPGERVQGTTTPLYTLLMSVVYRLTTDLLHAGNLLSAVFLFITCLLSLSLLRDFLSVYGRATVVVLQVTSPLVYVSFGMETLFYCSVLMLSFWLWSKERRTAAMLAAAALTWTRADGLVLGGTLWLLAAVEAWRSHQSAHPLSRLRAIPWRLGFVYLAGIAPWFVFAWLYFGTPLPNTFSAKQQLFSGLGFLEEGLTWWRAFYGNNPFTLLAIPLAGLGIWRALRQPRLRPVAVWTVLYLAGYTALNVNAFWYFTPLVVMLIILTGLGAEWFTQQTIGLRWSRGVVLAAALATVIATTGLGVASALSYAVPPGRVETYRLVGQWIEHSTQPDQSILVGDLGIVGYHARRRTRDVPGLITPDMHFKLDSYGVAKYKLDYVVATRYFTWLRVQEQDWFRYHYAPLTQISSSGDEFSPMTVYRRRLPVEMPTQMIEGFDLPLTCSVDLEPGERLPPDMRARLRSPAGPVLAEAAHPFLWGQYPAERAAASERLIDQIALPLALPAGIYGWELACDRTTEGQVEILPIEKAAGYASVSGARWEPFAQLRGIVFPDGAATWSGGTLTVALHWRTLGAADAEYSVFLHLVDAEGKLLAQLDGYPVAGSRPPTAWRPEETIVDIRRMPLSPDLAEGEYHLIVGWYDWRTGRRVPMITGEESVSLPGTVHNRWPGGSGLP